MRHNFHDFAVAKHFGTADVEHAANGGGCSEYTQQIVDYVADCDGLAGRADPFWRDHYGQPFHEIAQNLKRRGARTDDHGRAKDGNGNLRRAKRRLDLTSRRQMLAQIRTGLTESAQVNDAFHACFGGGL